jgi:para-nitrobenzyl esterase
MFGIGAITIAERKYAQHGAPIYMYIFSHESEAIVPGTQHKVGAAHALEIPYKFYNVQPSGQTGTGMMSALSPEDERTAHNMAEMWSAFARTSMPTAKGQPAWPAYNTEKRATMDINAECKIVNDPNGSERKMWEKLEA